ncbi:MAG: YegP family protein [Xanthomonadales bacterium]|nr:YegP family protein [Xanthomonadales bacterium]
MAGKFACSTGSDGKFYFSLKAGNGEVILSSQGYADKGGRDNGIDSVRKNGGDAGNFRKETAKDGRFFFNLVAGNGQVIGKSQMYKTESGRDNGIESVGKNAADATVVEEE